MISLPPALQELRTLNGEDVPPPVRGMALIDTGAFGTAIDIAVFKRLGIQPFGRVDTVSAHGDGSLQLYPASISFPTLGMEDLPMQQIMGCDLHWRAEKDTDFMMLLGRDLLKNFLVVYNGKHSEVTLAF
jgi:hypothetical protein